MIYWTLFAIGLFILWHCPVYGPGKLYLKISTTKKNKLTTSVLSINVVYESSSFAVLNSKLSNKKEIAISDISPCDELWELSILRWMLNVNANAVRLDCRFTKTLECKTLDSRFLMLYTLAFDRTMRPS